MLLNSFLHATRYFLTSSSSHYAEWAYRTVHPRAEPNRIGGLNARARQCMVRKYTSRTESAAGMLGTIRFGSGMYG